MASSIVLRTYGDGDDKKISLSNATCARLLSIGNTWNKIRVGIRLMVNAAANITGTPAFAVGVCSGTSNPWNNGAATTTNFVGCITAQPSWTYTTNVMLLNSGNVDFRVATRVGTTTTFGLQPPSVLVIPALSYDIRGVIFVDITKGSPNYTVNVFSPTSITLADVTQTAFFTQVAAEVSSISNYAFGTPRTIAVDEGNGILNAVNIGWDKSVSGTIEISDLAIVRFS